MLFSIIVIMEILSVAAIDICVPSFSEIQTVFKLTPFAVEFILGINLLSHCIGALIVGNLGDRYGRKPIILYGLLLFIFGSLLCMCSMNYSTLLCGRFLQGIGISCPGVLAYVIIPDTYDVKTHQKLLGYLNFFTTLAMAVAPLIGSYVTLYFGWRGNFGLLLFLGVVCLFLGWMLLPKGIKNYKISISLSEYKKIFKNPEAMQYIFTVCCFVVGYWVFIAMAPILYINELGVKLEQFGWYQGSLAAAFAIASASNEKLFNIFGLKKCFSFGIILIVISLISIVLLSVMNVRNPIIITTALAVMSAGIIFPVNILFPHVFKAAPNEKGKIGALTTFTKLVSISLLVQIAGYYYNNSFFIIGIIISSTTIVALVLCKKLLQTNKIFED